jgi:Tol biopolymer transport system component
VGGNLVSFAVGSASQGGHNMGRFIVIAEFALTSLCLLLFSCAEELPEPFLPEVVNLSISEGQELAGDGKIVVTFNAKMESVEMDVSGAAGTIKLDPTGKIATWTPSSSIPTGVHTLTITGRDTFHQDIAKVTTSFTVSDLHDSEFPSVPELTGITKIAFSSNRNSDGGMGDIYLMKPDGTEQLRLTSSMAYDLWPSWSPDCSKIAFMSNPDDNTEIYVMDIDGTNKANLTNHPGKDKDPSWSPDGERIAFASNRDGNFEIYAMNSDGTNQIKLSNDPKDDQHPSWSPDGMKIAFLLDYHVYIMNADGTGKTRLSDVPSEFPVWSPDGNKVAFSGYRDAPHSWEGIGSEIYVINSDGTEQKRLTEAEGETSDKRPTWSPDGTEIAFTSNRDGDYDIYVMNADGTAQRKLTSDPGDDVYPAWSPFLPAEIDSQ